LIGSFLKYNSKLSIQLVYEDGEEVWRAFKAGELDVVILPDVSKELGIDTSEFEVRSVLRDEMWLVASSKDVAVPGAISLRDLNSRPLVKFTERYFGFDKMLKTEAERQNAKLKSVFESNNVGTVKRVIESGLGWGFLPAHSIRKQVRAGRMTAIEVENFKFEVPVMFYMRKNDPNTQIHEVFYTAMKPPVGAS
jgi:DNA-binding transcriptional LysR family regulator